MRRSRSAILLILLLSSQGGSRGQTIRARGYQRFGERDQRATGSELENLQVEKIGECAARAIYRNARGFNFNRNPDSEGRHHCQPSNRYPSCHSTKDWESSAGYDYYYGGYAGQNEPVKKTNVHHGLSTSFPSDRLTWPATLSLDDPNYRWPADCNYPLNNNERMCSRQILTGIYDNEAKFTDLDQIRCYQYGADFRVSQEIGAVVDVQLRWNPVEHECPPHQVVTALLDQSDVAYLSVDKMKCNLLLGNWRVDYEQCTTTEISGRGGGPRGNGDNWHVGTPRDQTWAVVGMWRVGRAWSGWKMCRLYRMA